MTGARDPKRFDLTGAKRLMWAVVTTGNGGYDKLVFRQVPVPTAGPGEVLLQVLAAGVNNTEINTRLGWYSRTVGDDTAKTAQVQETAASHKEDGGWSAPTPFPFIQGTDCCGRVVELGQGADRALMGKRVLVRPAMRTAGFSSLDHIWMASDFDGAFAQFVKVPAGEVFPIDCGWSDVELGSIPCAYGTAENMLHRAGLGKGQRVLIAGASGGVGSAAVQLAKRRGAEVIAEAGRDKWPGLKALGVDHLLDRGADPSEALGRESLDLVVDNVGGEGFGGRIEALRRGGKFASSGAIAGPLVTLDMRRFYLKDLTLIGCTAWDEPVFPNLIGYIERGEIKPLIAATFPLEKIADAQRVFLEKKHLGKFVLIPPAL